MRITQSAGFILSDDHKMVKNKIKSPMLHSYSHLDVGIIKLLKQTTLILYGLLYSYFQPKIKSFEKRNGVTFYRRQASYFLSEFFSFTNGR